MTDVQHTPESGSGSSIVIPSFFRVIWSELVDAAAARLLAPTGWVAPTTGYPTGAQWISAYLAPLADALGEGVRFGSRVVGVSRRGRDRLLDSGRTEHPFIVHVESADGVDYHIDARAVIDASGTWSTPNPAGADELPARGALGAKAKELVDGGLINLVTGFRIEQVTRAGEQAVLVAEDGRALPTADQVLILTGFRPDLSFLSELRIELDPTLQAPVRIAAEIDPNIHSCGSVAATGARDLAQPEPDFYIVGAKSYGRAPTFLAMTGYEQVRSVVAELAGDHEAAQRVELVLPDTGACGGAGLFDASGASLGGSCCAVPKQTLQIGRAPAAV